MSGFKKQYSYGIGSACVCGALLLALSFLVMTSSVQAWGPGAGGPPADAPWKNAQKFKQNLVKKLNLTEEQSALHDKMHAARRAFMEKACSEDKAEGCRQSKLRKRLFHLFRAELAAENPDFAGVAAKLKAEYHGKYKTEFDAMVDSRAAFMGSLTQEQREKLLELRPRRAMQGIK